MTDGDVTTIAASISAIVAGLIGGWAGAYFTDKKSHNRQEEDKRKQTIDSLKAIKSEIESILQAYKNSVGKAIDDMENQENTKTLGIYPEVPDGYFSIYQSHSGILGTLEDNDLAKNIIFTYIRFMGIFEALKLNNQFWNVRESAIRSLLLLKGEDQFTSELLGDTFTTKFLKGYDKNLKSITEDLKKRQPTLYSETNDLINNIDIYIEKKSKID